MNLTPEFEKKLDEAVTHYPVSKRSAALPLLHLWQEEYGFISDAAVELVAAKLDMQPVHILELVTFYPMFRRVPVGKHHIKVCRTLSCALGGSHETHACLKKLTAADGDPHGPCTSSDGKYTVEFVECLASCDKAPVVMGDDDLYENVNTEGKAQAILGKYS
ncbi:MAG: NAD(P)H-dependent oxidoreductase subunit E [Verrucomicrobiales bacterium]|jgi:NADH-quinone oxidoreductase subunit E|nr:NAD(P)H-dependent oxidoreductase subunit E [Verrucomicrobiales bacterium]